MRRLLLALLFVFSVSLAAYEPQLVRGLPGQPAVRFKHYAGRISVDQADSKELFYWFYEADHPNASQLPLILWLNGGPGCSSVGAGALNEIGPFRVTDQLELTSNPYSWNRASNIIFLDSPAGTGFSVSKKFGPFSDENTATDIISFLLKWFGKFPEYRQNDFYITGESYAGHYIPTLALQVLSQNDTSFRINLKGFAIGNPLTDVQEETLGKLQFFVSHSIISQGLYAKAVGSCSFSPYAAKCKAAQAEVSKQTRYLDRYNAYGPVCKSLEDCTKNSALYLNLDTVQTALHLGTRKVSWVSCNAKLKSLYSTTSRNASMVQLYEKLVRTGIRIWIYSGDFDTVVPTISTIAWISRLNLPVKIPWYAWNYQNQVGGWSEVYSGLTFTTVRGAGHKAPADQPGPSFEIFTSFLKDKALLPNTMVGKNKAFKSLKSSRYIYRNP